MSPWTGNYLYGASEEFGGWKAASRIERSPQQPSPPSPRGNHLPAIIAADLRKS
jgi:hypothetical protein